MMVTLKKEKEDGELAARCERTVYESAHRDRHRFHQMVQLRRDRRTDGQRNAACWRMKIHSKQV